MNNQHHTHYSADAQPAQIRTSRVLVSTVWLVPLATAIVGGWLLIKNIHAKTQEVTLLMDNAEGIEINNTTIRVLDVEVGRVTAIRLNSTRDGVEITAQLNKESMDLMRKDTQFWVVKPRIDQNGVTGLSTLLSGSYISFAPGISEESEDTFKVSELPPISALGESGMRLNLVGKNKKMVNVGSPVLFENHIVGTVETAKFNPTDQTVHYSIFIQSPNESLINGASSFWLDDGIDIRLDGGGINIQTPPVSALLSGAISFDSPRYKPNADKKVNNGDEFAIHNNRAEIENTPGPRTLYYVTFFNSSIRGLDVGAPVIYKGIRIGNVADIPYFQNDDQQHLFKNGWIPVRIRIEPYLIEGQSTQHRPDKEQWQQTIQAALDNGLTATITSNNLILGSKLIELVDNRLKENTLKPYQDYQGHTVIASSNGDGIDEIQQQLAKLLEKINSLPLDQSIQELNGSLKEIRQLMGTVNQLLNQSETQSLPQELKNTLQELQQTLQGISPQSPAYQEVQNTLRNLDKTLKNAQPILNTLTEQPNALIFNSSKKDPTPKGSQ